MYSGFSHLCFWQCSESIFTGSFPVHDAPPINFLTSGLLGASPASAGPPISDGPPAPCGGLRGFGSLSEFEKTMKLSSGPVVGGACFLDPPPPPGFPPFVCPFLTIFGQIREPIVALHITAKYCVGLKVVILAHLKFQSLASCKADVSFEFTVGTCYRLCTSSTNDIFPTFEPQNNQFEGATVNSSQGLKLCYS